MDTESKIRMSGLLKRQGMHARNAAPARRWLCLLGTAMALAAFALTGCDDDDDIDHQPPEGQGAIVIDNDGYRDLHVYIDGAYQGEVRDGHRTAYDRAPGVYRVVLDESGSDRGYRNDVDVLAGRLTVIEATGGEPFGDDLYVSVFYE
jgi:hypothetical protein